MIWLSNYDQELELAFDQAAQILSTLPPSFNKQALEYLDKFHALKQKRSKNYICYLLPYWLQNHFNVKPSVARNFAVANIFGMLYYHLIDEIMDQPIKPSKYQLPLADLIYLEFHNIYSKYFPYHSPFWSYYKQYIVEWAEAVTEEDDHDYFQTDPILIAHKASPLKVAIVGSLLVTQYTNSALIVQLEDAVDLVLLTLQMLDDYEDWEKDLKEGSYNCLISMIQSELQIPHNRRPNVEEIKHAIYVQDILVKYAEIAVNHHKQVTTIQHYAPDLVLFHNFLYKNLIEAGSQIAKDRLLLQSGGLSYWIAKNR
jgi:hypothetical protein